MTSWSRWYSFNRTTIKKLKSKLENRVGVYSIRRIKKNGNPKPLNRISRKDKFGILHYGETTNLFDRLTHFVGKCDGGEYPHSAAWTYIEYFSRTRWFEKGLMEFRWKFCKNEKMARTEEGNLLRGYRKKFMDSPPLNSSG